MTAERAPLSRAGLDAEYEIIRELGIGGTAIVYLARKRSTGDEVAIKLIRAAYLEDPEAIARFEREARLASRLDHPNVVPIREVLPLGAGGVALIMAHVAGRTLKQFIRENGQVSPDRAEHILRDVAAGLNAAHEMGIVHRDVKPENIFVDESDTALLADFGLARSTAGDSQLTMSGVAIGTPTYMPPETIDGGIIDMRGDIYSLGLVAWEMLSGRRPWDGASLYALLYHQKHDYLPDIREIRSDVDDRFADVIATAIEKDPDLRWQSVDEMIAALDRVVPSRRAGVKPYVSSDTVQVSRATLAPIIEPAASSVSPAPLEIVDPSPATAPTFDVGPRVGEPNTLVLPGRTAFVDHSLEPIGDEQDDAGLGRWFIPAAVLVVLLVLAGGVGLRFWLEAGNRTETQPVAASTRVPSSVAAPAPPAVAVGEGTPQAGTADSARATASSADSLATAREAAAPALDDKKQAPLAPLGSAGSSTLAGPAKKPAAREVAVAATPPAKQPAATVPTPEPSVSATRPPVVAPTTAAAPIVGRSLPVAARGSIVAGGMHTCLIASDGRAYCWGSNARGQSGSAAGARVATPTVIGGGLELTSMTAGLSHSCALARGGAVWCWGENDHGQLGDHSTSARAAPTRVASTRVFHAIAAGESHTCGLDTDGETWCWGAGAHGQLGNESYKDSNAPVAVPGARFIQIAAGWNFTCALDASGHASCWGENGAGQLGTRDTTDRALPTPVATDLTFESIAAGSAHTCGVTSRGEVYCWGKNSTGQLGDGTTTSRMNPTRVKSDVQFTLVTAGAVHTCGIDTNGRAHCWGMDSYGQLGDGGSGMQPQPVRVTGGQEFTSLRAFGSHTCGTTTSGEAFCWGYNLDGQLGDGTRMNRSRPVYIEPPTGK